MAKQNGLGDQLFISGYDISGDVGTVGRIAKPSPQLDVTAINASGHERIYAHVDGAIDFTAFFNDATSPTNQEHAALKAKGSGADQIVTYFHGSTIGNMAAGLVAKQINYDGTRAADGSLTFNVQALANAKGLDFGEMLTAGKRTDSAATNGSGLDGLAASANGLVAYLQVFAFSGTSVTVKVQMDDNSGFLSPTDLLTFTAANGVTAERKVTAAVDTAVERYLRVVTTGTFSNAVFAVMASRFVDVL